MAPYLGLTRPHTGGGPEKHYIIEAKGGGAALLDFDDDGDLDIYWVNGATLEAPDSGAGNALYRNDGTGGFVDVAAAQKVLGRGWGMGAISADYDNDGDADLYVTNLRHNILYRNDGGGHFEMEVLFKAPVDYYGLSGIEPVDLDEDGDIDILFTNGDTLDFPEEQIDISPNNFYGLAWLENDGSGNFALHEITRYWGAFAVKAVDLDGDDDLDLVLSGMQIANIYPEAEVQNVIWMENDGDQGFTRHTLDIALPPLMLTLEVVDADGDGVPDIIGGSHDFTGREVGHRLVVFNIPIDN